MNNENNNSFNFKKLPWGWILLGITLWFLFPWIYSVLFDFIIRNPESYGTRFGAVGDIYGSLNAFVSSAALCAVAYSTWLQVTSLRETRKANSKQVRLAKKSHKEQIKESQHAIFTNAFYALLNLKENKFNSLEITIDEGVYKANNIFRKLSLEFDEIMKSDWSRGNLPSCNEIKTKFNKILSSKEDEAADIICSYYLIYDSLYDLVNNNKFLENNEKYFYKQLISNSMRIQEQITLCYISCFIARFRSFLYESQMFGQFYDPAMSDLVKKYLHESNFYGDDWTNHFK